MLQQLKKPPNSTQTAGKSLTAHEVVRQCWRPAQPAGDEPGTGSAAQQEQQEGQQEQQEQGQVAPPALISINCMSLTDPKQVRGLPGLGFAGCLQAVCLPARSKCSYCTTSHAPLHSCDVMGCGGGRRAACCLQVGLRQSAAC